MLSSKRLRQSNRSSLRIKNADSLDFTVKENDSHAIKSGDSVEAVYPISGQDVDGKCWARVLAIKGKKVTVQWFYDRKELMGVIKQECPSFLKKFLALESLENELYFSEDVNILSADKIKSRISPIQPLCQECATSTTRKRRRSYNPRYWYSFTFDRTLGMVPAACSSCGQEPSTANGEVPLQCRTAGKVTKKRLALETASKSVSEQRVKKYSSFRSTRRKIQLAETTPEKCHPRRNPLKSNRQLTTTEIEDLVSTDCERTPVKGKKRTGPSSVKRKLVLDQDPDYDVNMSEAQSESEDDVYEFLNSESECSPASDSDEDFVVIPQRKRTPSKSSSKSARSSKTPRKAKSTVKKGSKKESQRNVTTTISRRKKKNVSSTLTKVKASMKDLSICLPKRTALELDGPESPYQLAQKKLHLSAVPETLPCREDEFMQIFNFVEKKLKTRSGGCLYISGVPGTGKTATVHEVVRSLNESREEGIVSDFKFVDINGMRLTTPYQAYSAIWQQLKGERVSPDHAANLLNKYFQGSQSTKSAVVLLADELDLLWTKKQSILYSLFDWPTRPKVGLIVLAIANTMDLPERIMMNRVSSRLGLTRLTFQPYTFKQLQEIVQSRLEGLKVFEPDALQLAARKVAAVSGDARRALNICRRATEMAERSTSEGGKERLVGIKDVDAAVTEMFSSPYIMAMRSASLLEQAFLKAVVAEFRRLGIEEATFENVYKQLVGQCRIEGIKPPNTSTVSSVCCRLFLSRLILVEAGRLDIKKKIRLNVSVDDVVFALQKKQNI